jgi:hypothetical protein
MDAETGLGIFLVFGMCVVVPLALIGGVVWIVVRSARHRHEQRMAAIARGGPPPVDEPQPPPPPPAASAGDPARGIGWAVGLLSCGVLWACGVDPFASMLVGAGAGFLTRGVLGLRRDAAARRDASLPPGGFR